MAHCRPEQRSRLSRCAGQALQKAEQQTVGHRGPVLEVDAGIEDVLGEGAYLRSGVFSCVLGSSESREQSSPSKPGVDQNESFRGGKQQACGITGLAPGEGHLAAEAQRCGQLAVAGSPRLGLVEQCPSLVETSRGEGGFGGGEEAVAAELVVDRQLGRTGEESRGGRVTAAVPGTRGRLGKLGRQRLVRSGGRHGQMPGYAVGLLTRVGQLREGPVNHSAVSDRHAVVGDRADEGMAERDRSAEVGQPYDLGLSSSGIHAQAPSSITDERIAGGRFGRGHRQQEPGARR